MFLNTEKRSRAPKDPHIEIETTPPAALYVEGLRFREVRATAGDGLRGHYLYIEGAD